MSYEITHLCDILGREWLINPAGAGGRLSGQRMRGLGPCVPGGARGGEGAGLRTQCAPSALAARNAPLAFALANRFFLQISGHYCVSAPDRVGGSARCRSYRWPGYGWSDVMLEAGSGTSATGKGARDQLKSRTTQAAINDNNQMERCIKEFIKVLCACPSTLKIQCS